MKKTPIVYLFLLLLFSCQPPDDMETHKQEIQTWKSERMQRLKSDNGYLNLAGLYWLDEGENSLGSAPSNRHVFPEGNPELIGVIERDGDHVTLIPGSNRLMINDSLLSDPVMLKHDMSGSPDVISHGSFRWHIIKRDSLMGIRLRNLNHPRLHQLDSIPAFPLDPEWKKKAVFTAYETVDTLMIPTVIGIDEEYHVPGKVEFRHEGEKYSLLPFETQNGFFFIIGDVTSAKETYAGGRFLYTPKPDKNNQVYLDFNKAYNPPCAFSAFATCPLPPPENRLNLRIAAGEKAVHLD